ncbi:fungal chitosanase of glycosyl hydrolase group 75-domain-containing protein [Aspergillus recurvatus]
MSSIKCIRLVAVLFFSAPVLCQNIDGSHDDYPNGGPPASYFSAAPTMPVAALQSAASRLGRTSREGSFRVSSDSSERSSIYSDWASFNEGAAVVWTADMDVDCDGIDYGCKGNPDGLPKTSWGALAAYEVPFIVIPEHYLDMHQDSLPGNNIAAVICNGNMFYAILGDTNGDSPEVTGEASWLMARTCFPNEGLSGATGHDDPDVTYIVFLGRDAVLPASAVNERYITGFETLRSMGDALVNALVRNIGLGSGDGTRARTRTRNPSFKHVAPAMSSRSTASFLTARSWVTSSRLLEQSAVSPSAAPSDLAIASVSTPAGSFPSVSSPSIATPSSSSSSFTISAASPATNSNAAAPNTPPPSITSPNTPAASAPSSIPSSALPSAAAPNAATGPSSNAASAPTPIGSSASALGSIPPASASVSSVTTGPPGAAAGLSIPATGSASVAPPSAAVPIAPPNAAAPDSATPGTASAPSAASSAGGASPPGAVPPASAAAPASVVSSPAVAAPNSAIPPSTVTGGTPCSTLDDCSDDLICVSGLCAVDQDLMGSTAFPTLAARRRITTVRGNTIL